MISRRYFAWRMLTEAARASEDERLKEQRRIREQRRYFDVNSISDKKFVQLYRLTKRAFFYLCTILRENSDLKSSQRVSLETKVLCALLFYANGDYQRVIGKANLFSQECISRFLHQVTEALNNPRVIQKFIKFPATLEERQRVVQNFYDTYGFPGVVGCIDGSHFKIVKPQKDLEHMFYCRKHYHSLNVQIVADHQGRILAINPKFGGASHDAFVFDNSNINFLMKSLHRGGESVWLLGDSGYPQRPWLMTPYSRPSPNSAEESYNRIHSRTRVIVENTFGRIKNRWRCLCKDRVLHYQPEKCAKIIIACSVLHNLALDFKIPQDQFGETEDNSSSFTIPQPADDDTSMLNLGRQLRDRIAIRLHMHV